MKITLRTSASISMARHLFRGSGYGLTVRYGSIYTFVNQPTELLRATRSLFAEANKLAYAEMRNPERCCVWQEVASRFGYKTARGAAHAHFIRLLRQRKQTSSSRAASASPAVKQSLRPALYIPLPRISRNIAHIAKRPVSHKFSLTPMPVLIHSSA